MSENSFKPTKFKMITPLELIEINTAEPLHLELNENEAIVRNDQAVFDSYNSTIIGTHKVEYIQGRERIPFTYYPLLAAAHTYVENFPTAALDVLDGVLKSLSLFKTTNTILHVGQRLMITVDDRNMGGIVVTQGSCLLNESKGLPKYSLNLNELASFKEFYNKFIQIFRKLDKNNRIKLGIEFYSKASRTADIVEKFIFLSVALEILFSNESSELGYRFSNRISLLLGNDLTQRIITQKNVSKIYNKRSTIVHGNVVDPPSFPEFVYLNELIRSSILQLLSLINEPKYSDYVSVIDSFILKQDSTEYQEFQKQKLLFGPLSEFKFVSLENVMNSSL